MILRAIFPKMVNLTHVVAKMGIYSQIFEFIHVTRKIFQVRYDIYTSTEILVPRLGMFCVDIPENVHFDPHF